ncbi:hypothetical protein BDV33DRAFT_185747, partial [Aspergillus novoparasiticus]
MDQQKQPLQEAVHLLELAMDRGAAPDHLGLTSLHIDKLLAEPVAGQDPVHQPPRPAGRQRRAVGRILEEISAPRILRRIEELLEIGLDQLNLRPDKAAKPGHGQPQLLVRQRLLILTPVDVALAGRGVLHLFPVRPQAGDPAKGGPHPVEEEALPHRIQGVRG